MCQVKKSYEILCSLILYSGQEWLFTKCIDLSGYEIGSLGNYSGQDKYYILFTNGEDLLNNLNIK